MNAPLCGIVVLDLTRAVSGPYCTMMLQHLGATVIKVEKPRGGDDTRHLGPYIHGESSYHAVFNAGKKSIALDIKKSDDQAILEALIARADVFVENFRPGALDKIGYGPDALRKRHPRLVYASISGYGLTGPIADHSCYDIIAQGLSGIMTLTGEKNGKPTKVGTEIADILAGIFTAFGINTALYHRALNGEGSLVDVAMLDAMVSTLFGAMTRFSFSHDIPKATGNRHATAVPFDTFETSDRSVNIAVANDHLFQQLCEVIGRPDLATNEQFATTNARLLNREALTNILSLIFKTRTAKEWVEACIDKGVPAGRVFDLSETMNFPQLNARNMICHFAPNYMDEIRFPGNPIKLSFLTDNAERPHAPALDENRDEIIRFAKTGAWSLGT